MKRQYIIDGKKVILPMPSQIKNPYCRRAYKLCVAFAAKLGIMEDFLKGYMGTHHNSLKDFFDQPDEMKVGYWTKCATWAHVANICDKLNQSAKWYTTHRFFQILLHGLYFYQKEELHHLVALQEYDQLCKNMSWAVDVFKQAKSIEDIEKALYSIKAK